MFTRLKTLRANGRTYQYVHIVENRWDGGKVRQRIVGSLGRLDELLASGDLKRVIEGLVQHCPQVKLAKAEREATLSTESDKVWGPVLVFERLWRELGLDVLFRDLARRRRFKFGVERCAFAIVLQRILAPGSDLFGSRWVKTVEADGFGSLGLADFYKTVGALWTWKDDIERHLFERGRDLFSEALDLVFVDTTSTYFEGKGWEGWAKMGKSRDHRPDHLQLMLAVAMRRDGVPITMEIWPGNTADIPTVKPMIDSLRNRFHIRRVVFVGDRGLVSGETLKALDDAGYGYIVGMKMRRILEVRENVLRRAGRYREVEKNLQVKEVWVDDRRYVVCVNPDRAEKDRHDREAILAKLRDKLAHGGIKSLVPNRGFRRFLKISAERAMIDEKRVEQDALFDGKYVLRTTTDLPAEEVAEAYKQLTWIERLWRELKDVMEVRPIYHHKKKNNVRGHIFASFLALYLSAMLRRRLDDQWRKDNPDRAEPPPRPEPPRLPVPWDQLMLDLAQVRAIRVKLGDERFRMRTAFKGHVDLAFRAVGVRPPPMAEPLK
jgi:hypothetical protein